MSSVTIRVDEDTKREVSGIVEDFGLDLSSITRAFYKQIVREQRIPLNLTYQKTPQESVEALKEARRMAKSGESRFDDADQMFDSLGI
jgi:DNA-damage-inducible protein J